MKAGSGQPGREGAARDRRVVSKVRRWFDRHAREMPWRILPRDPYRALVSEFMLQQTQVSRVLERFGEFVARFPTVESLAAADEGEVLAAWSGLGYYRRARNLHAAARAIVERFGGRVPETAEALITLPGVGRYTAGAVASIVFGQAVPIVDGNVARVLVRVDGRELATDEAMPWAWGRAEALIRAGNTAHRQRNGRRSAGPAEFNEGLMELGAVVCVPRAPRCGECPIRAECLAHQRGIQNRVPRPKKAPARRAMYCAAVIAQDGRGRLLLERRGDHGMWAGMWQVPTLEGRRRAARKVVEAWIGAEVRRIERFDHGATHRDVEFEVWRATGRVSRPGAVWRTPAEVSAMAISNAMRRVVLGGDGRRGG